MKKILALVLAMMLLVSMAACGASQPAPTTAPATEAPATEAPAETEAAAESYVIGICQLVQHDALDAATNGFMDAVKEAMGDSVTFDLQNAQGESSTCSTIVTGFVSNEYDLIMANATPALQAAMSATDVIPILGTSVTDYGTALANPDMDPAVGTGVNVSGTSDGVPGELYADTVMELVPDASYVAIVYCSAEPNSVVQGDSFAAAMAEKGVETKVFTFADSNDIQAVVTAAIEGADALYIPTDNTAASNMTIVANVCQPANIPVICGEENMCANGGLATVSISYYDIGYVCGQMAVEILMNGADVSAMPIGYAANPVKEYNAAYAEAIGFAMPETYAPIG